MSELLPREFWLVKRHAESLDHFVVYLPMERPEGYAQHLHVIEKSAYDQVVKERDDFEKKWYQSNKERNDFERKLTVALEALKFYEKELAKPTWAGLTVDGGKVASIAIAKILSK